jgi:hypothetical protein
MGGIETGKDGGLMERHFGMGNRKALKSSIHFSGESERVA